MIDVGKLKNEAMQLLEAGDNKQALAVIKRLFSHARPLASEVIEKLVFKRLSLPTDVIIRAFHDACSSRDRDRFQPDYNTASGLLLLHALSGDSGALDFITEAYYKIRGVREPALVAMAVIDPENTLPLVIDHLSFFRSGSPGNHYRCYCKGLESAGIRQHDWEAIKIFNSLVDAAFYEISFSLPEKAAGELIKVWREENDKVAKDRLSLLLKTVAGVKNFPLDEIIDYYNNEARRDYLYFFLPFFTSSHVAMIEEWITNASQSNQPPLPRIFSNEGHVMELLDRFVELKQHEDIVEPLLLLVRNNKQPISIRNHSINLIGQHSGMSAMSALTNLLDYQTLVPAVKKAMKSIQWRVEFERKGKTCYYCGELLEETNNSCPACEKEPLKCAACGFNINFEDEPGQCIYCDILYHLSHLREHVKIDGKCKSCNHSLKEEEVLVINREGKK